MLLAMAFWRADRPATATRSEDVETSSNTAVPFSGGTGARPWRSVRAIRCSYSPIRPVGRSAESETVAGGLHTKPETPVQGPGFGAAGTGGTDGSDGAVDVGGDPL